MSETRPARVELPRGHAGRPNAETPIASASEARAHT